jgi:hypothetical protein
VPGVESLIAEPAAQGPKESLGQPAPRPGDCPKFGPCVKVASPKIATPFVALPSGDSLRFTPGHLGGNVQNGCPVHHQDLARPL